MAQSPFEFIQAFQQHFGQFIPDLAKTAQADIEQHVRAAMLSFVEKLDLVSRDEFEAQTEVLRRTRERLEVAEGRLARLEEQVDRTAVQEIPIDTAPESD